MFTIKQITTISAFVVLIYPTNAGKENGTIYILIWTKMEVVSWHYNNLDSEIGYDAFVTRNCSFQNCYLTTNQYFLENVLDFDALLFNAVHLSHDYQKKPMPTQRSPNQLYVFFSTEPAFYYPMPATYNGFFNLTWTYKLKSDIVHPFFFIKNKIGKIMGPKINVDWLDINDTLPTDPSIVKKLERKSIAALWISSNCDPKRRKVVENLSNELSKYGHRVDNFGQCGDQSQCQTKKIRDGSLNSNCDSKIESDYYFYLAFENSCSIDYVSEKVLHALLHFSVPIVYGGANYTRFLPDGIYLNTKELGVEGVAIEMNKIINNRQRYYDFFKWHNYYSIHDNVADNHRESVCAFCAFLNNRTKSNETQVYENIVEWWNAYDLDEFLDLPKIASTLPPQVGEIVESSGDTAITSIFSKIIDFFSDYDEFFQ